MSPSRPSKLDPPVDPGRDHILSEGEAELTLVEYGSYTSPSCHAAHEVIADLRDRFGNRMGYVYRHRFDDEVGQRAAELAEYSSEMKGDFWPVHDALMKRGPVFTERDLEEVASQFNLPPRGKDDTLSCQAAALRVQEDLESAQRSGVVITPTFFINGRRYEGPWDENTLAEAILGTLGHRLHAATVDFVRWGPSAGLLLLLISILAVVLANSAIGPAFERLWRANFGFQLGVSSFVLPLLSWVNHGLLSIFFLVVGLEIKREFTVGRLSTFRSGALPVIAAFGGIVVPIG